MNKFNARSVLFDIEMKYYKFNPMYGRYCANSSNPTSARRIATWKLSRRLTLLSEFERVVKWWNGMVAGSRECEYVIYVFAWLCMEYTQQLKACHRPRSVLIYFLFLYLDTKCVAYLCQMVTFHCAPTFWQRAVLISVANL